MKRFLNIFFLLLIPGLSVINCYGEFTDYAFYTKLGSGISCSQTAQIVAPYPPWNPALQGYDAKLGNSPIVSFSLGCELGHTVDLQVSIDKRANFKYLKYQTPTTGGDSYTRQFGLNISSVMFTANLLGQKCPYVSKEIGCGKLYPMIGVGLGASHLLISSFRTVGLPPTGDSTPYASFSSENQYTPRKSFTYTLQAGLEYNYHDCWAVGTGYRWFNAGHFAGPRYFRVANGAAVDVGSDTWDIRFRSNEWFIEFKIFI